jgi:hypothetical protein
MRSSRVLVHYVDGVRTVGNLRPLWIEGTTRGTFTLIRADGAVHRESFEVGTGVLLWKADAMTFVLQGAASKAEAMRLAADVEPLAVARRSSCDVPSDEVLLRPRIRV